MTALDVVNIHKAFFGTVALDDVTFSVGEHELLSIVGPNGSGKTTLFNILSGFLNADAGRVHLFGEDITRLPPHAIARKGMVRSFQDVRVFGRLTVLDNLLIAVQQHQEESLFGRFVWSPAVRQAEREAIERATEVLALLRLSDFRDELAWVLSYGQRKLLEFGIAIMSRPRVLLLDEPAAAVNPTLINALMEHIVAYREDGHTVVLIEHNMEVVMNISERILVLDYGKLIAEGKPQEIRENALVLEAYFGH